MNPEAITVALNTAIGQFLNAGSTNLAELGLQLGWFK